MSTALVCTFSPSVNGQALSYGIYTVSPQNSYSNLQNATVGTPVTVFGTIYTENGNYNLYLGNTLVSTGQADIHYISANFTVPDMVGSNYNLVLKDVALNQNYTYYFPILTSYQAQAIVPTSPSQLHEGDNVALNVTITGANASTTYDAEITVVPPAALGLNYTKHVTLTTSATGSAHAQITFPDSSFSPSGSSTLYAGTYTVYFNASQALGQSTFAVGFTDVTQYHRGDTVNMDAIGYQPNQGATVAIQFDNHVISSQTVTASSAGVITYSWTVPSNAAIGTYTVTISTQTAPSKAVPDQQTFQVPGYPYTFKVVNLAGQVVPTLVVEALDQATNIVYNGTTANDGTVVINLEKGVQTVAAYWNDAKVAETQVTVSGTGSSTITGQLTNLVVKVQDKNGVVIPFVNLNLTLHYTTRSGSTESLSASGQTDLSGVYSFNSSLTGVTYTVQASKYDTVFNAGNDTISTPPAQPSSTAVIICPDENVALQTVDYNFAALPNARITLIEQASGIFYSVTTDSNGNAQLQVTFGQYQANVYTSDNILLNQTIINVLSSGAQMQIRNVIYNLPVSVKVVDYFGAPISNVNVELSRAGLATQSATTQGNGIATFGSVIGGNVEITAYASGNSGSYVSQNLNIESASTVELKMDRYVAFGGAVIDASLLAVIIIIVVALVLLVVFEVFRKVGFKLRRNRA
jgi:hypothetical protein